MQPVPEPGMCQGLEVPAGRIQGILPLWSNLALQHCSSGLQCLRGKLVSLMLLPQLASFRAEGRTPFLKIMMASMAATVPPCHSVNPRLHKTVAPAS